MLINNPIKVLEKEHEIITRLNDIIQKIYLLWEKDSVIYVQIVNDLLLFISEYSDGFHHYKEEEVLFPTIREHPSFNLQEILDELLEHHEDFRNYKNEIIDALELKDFILVQNKLSELIDHLLDHIAVENEELFIMAENLLDPSDLEKMYFQFEDIDRELSFDKKKILEAIPESINKLLAK
ncbi:MAG: hemerythrin domain-containing protein [Bacteroidia bacterium]|nr:hemerythrin domain-containing protein [Bacteroidia bacterium]